VELKENYLFIFDERKILWKSEKVFRKCNIISFYLAKYKIIHTQNWKLGVNYFVAFQLLIIALNTIFNVAWEETYDYLFGIYGMTPIPYFPIP